MPTYLAPGVYVEEVEAGSRPIEGVGTAVAAFVGFAERGPFDTPTLVTNWGQFTQTFGEFVQGYYLAQSVYGYFNNGGTTCYVVRIGGSRGNGSPPELTAGPQAALGGYLVRAKDSTPGKAAAGDITVEVADPEGDSPGEDRFTLLVKRGGKV